MMFKIFTWYATGIDKSVWKSATTKLQQAAVSGANI